MINLTLTLRVFAFLEGVSLLLLVFLAMPLKYIYDDPRLVSYTGMIHGILFIGYSINLSLVYFKYKLEFWKMLMAFGLAFIPFGTFYADKYVFGKLKAQKKRSLSKTLFEK